MVEIKSELQLNFNTIADFTNYLRSLVSPYSKIAENLKFERINRPEERVTINMPDSGTMIVLDWNILVIVKLGNTTSIDDPDGAYRFFFDLYKKIANQDYFNDLSSIRLLTWDLIEDKYQDYKSFQKKFLKDNHQGGFNHDDISLTFDGSDDRRKLSYSYTFGPFKYLKDIKNYNLSLHNKDVFDNNDLTKSGCLCNVSLSSKKTKFDIETLSEMLSLKEKIIKSI